MRLTRREKLLIAGALAALLAYTAYQLAVRPTMQRVETLERVLADKRHALAELQSKSAQYLALQGELARLRERIAEHRSGPGALSFIERAASDCGLTANIADVHRTTSPLNDTYAQAMMEIKLERVALEQIMQFLLRVQSSNALLGIRSLRLKHAAADAKLLDAVVWVSTLVPVEGG